MILAQSYLKQQNPRDNAPLNNSYSKYSLGLTLGTGTLLLIIINTCT